MAKHSLIDALFGGGPVYRPKKDRRTRTGLSGHLPKHAVNDNPFHAGPTRGRRFFGGK